jgi:hypothetical protein
VIPRSLAALAILIAACSGSANDAHTTGAREADPRAPNEPSVDRPEIDPESVCGRSLACCRAYAQAIPNVVEDSACAGVYEALGTEDPDARCENMKAGWREALVHLNGGAAACE